MQRSYVLFAETGGRHVDVVEAADEHAVHAWVARVVDAATARGARAVLSLDVEFAAEGGAGPRPVQVLQLAARADALVVHYAFFAPAPAGSAERGCLERLFARPGLTLVGRAIAADVERLRAARLFPPPHAPQAAVVDLATLAAQLPAAPLQARLGGNAEAGVEALAGAFCGVPRWKPAKADFHKPRGGRELFMWLNNPLKDGRSPTAPWTPGPGAPSTTR